jgi:hypothetical protein
VKYVKIIKGPRWAIGKYGIVIEGSPRDWDHTVEFISDGTYDFDRNELKEVTEAEYESAEVMQS